jgi:hypothetical protein
MWQRLAPPWKHSLHYCTQLQNHGSLLRPRFFCVHHR